MHTQNFLTDQMHNQKFGAHWSRCSEKDEDDGCGTKIFHKENPIDFEEGVWHKVMKCNKNLGFFISHAAGTVCASLCCQVGALTLSHVHWGVF